MAARFISASSVKVGIGHVHLDLPPVWAPGDLLLVMSYCPSRSAAIPAMTPSGWTYHPSWMYTKIATSNEIAPTYTMETDANTPIGGFIAAYRGVENTTFTSYPEQGAVHPSAGSAFTFPDITIPSNTTGVYCFQSESTNSYIDSRSLGSGLGLVDRGFSGATINGTPWGWPSGDYTMNLGMVEARVDTGQAVGALTWYVTNSTSHPYYVDSEVSFFSYIGLHDGTAGKVVAITPVSGVVDGSVTVTGSMSTSSTINITAPGASIGSITYPSDRTWAVTLSGITSDVTVTATDNTTSDSDSLVVSASLANITQAPNNISSSGAFTVAPVTSTLGITQALNTAALSGAFSIPEVSGTISKTQPLDLIASTGTHTIQPVTSTSSIAQSQNTVQAHALFVPVGEVGGIIYHNCAPNAISASGSFVVQPASGTIGVVQESNFMVGVGLAVPMAVTGDSGVTQSPDIIAALGSLMATQSIIQAWDGSGWSPLTTLSWNGSGWQLMEFVTF
jgi:hypothetical protein